MAHTQQRQRERQPTASGDGQKHGQRPGYQEKPGGLQENQWIIYQYHITSCD